MRVLWQAIRDTSMKRTRHSEAEIRRMLQEADAALAEGATIPSICKKLGISEATYHRWRKRTAGDGAVFLSPRGGKEDWARRVKELERENKRLKQLVGQLMLDIAFLKDTLEARNRR